MRSLSRGSYYTATDQSDYIREIYAQAQRQALEALEGRVTRTSWRPTTRKRRSCRASTGEAKNRTAAAGETAQQGMNERFTASGLNTGRRARRRWPWA